MPAAGNLVPCSRFGRAWSRHLSHSPCCSQNALPILAIAILLHSSSAYPGNEPVELPTVGKAEVQYRMGQILGSMQGDSSQQIPVLLPSLQNMTLCGQLNTSIDEDGQPHGCALRYAWPKAQLATVLTTGAEFGSLGVFNTGALLTSREPLAGDVPGQDFAWRMSGRQGLVIDLWWRGPTLRLAAQSLLMIMPPAAAEADLGGLGSPVLGMRVGGGGAQSSVYQFSRGAQVFGDEAKKLIGNVADRGPFLASALYGLNGFFGRWHHIVAAINPQSSFNGSSMGWNDGFNQVETCARWAEETVFTPPGVAAVEPGLPKSASVSCDQSNTTGLDAVAPGSFTQSFPPNSSVSTLILGLNAWFGDPGVLAAGDAGVTNSLGVYLTDSPFTLGHRLTARDRSPKAALEALPRVSGANISCSRTHEAHSLAGRVLCRAVCLKDDQVPVADMTALCQMFGTVISTPTDVPVLENLCNGESFATTSASVSRWQDSSVWQASSSHSLATLLPVSYSMPLGMSHLLGAISTANATLHGLDRRDSASLAAWAKSAPWSSITQAFPSDDSRSDPVLQRHSKQTDEVDSHSVLGCATASPLLERQRQMASTVVLQMCFGGMSAIPSFRDAASALGTDALLDVGLDMWNSMLMLAGIHTDEAWRVEFLSAGYMIAETAIELAKAMGEHTAAASSVEDICKHPGRDAYMRAYSDNNVSSCVCMHAVFVPGRSPGLVAVGRTSPGPMAGSSSYLATTIGLALSALPAATTTLTPLVSVSPASVRLLQVRRCASRTARTSGINKLDTTPAAKAALLAISADLDTVFQGRFGSTQLSFANSLLDCDDDVGASVPLLLVAELISVLVYILLASWYVCSHDSLLLGPIGTSNHQSLLTRSTMQRRGSANSSSSDDLADECDDSQSHQIASACTATPVVHGAATPVVHGAATPVVHGAAMLTATAVGGRTQAIANRARNNSSVHASVMSSAQPGSYSRGKVLGYDASITIFGRRGRLLDDDPGSALCHCLSISVQTCFLITALPLVSLCWGSHVRIGAMILACGHRLCCCCTRKRVASAAVLDASSVAVFHIAEGPAGATAMRVSRNQNKHQSTHRRPLSVIGGALRVDGTSDDSINSDLDSLDSPTLPSPDVTDIPHALHSVGNASPTAQLPLRPPLRLSPEIAMRRSHAALHRDQTSVIAYHRHEPVEQDRPSSSDMPVLVFDVMDPDEVIADHASLPLGITGAADDDAHGLDRSADGRQFRSIGVDGSMGGLPGSEDVTGPAGLSMHWSVASGSSDVHTDVVRPVANGHERRSGPRLADAGIALAIRQSQHAGAGDDSDVRSAVFSRPDRHSSTGDSSYSKQDGGEGPRGSGRVRYLYRAEAASQNDDSDQEGPLSSQRTAAQSDDSGGSIWCCGTTASLSYDHDGDTVEPGLCWSCLTECRRHACHPLTGVSYLVPVHPNAVDVLVSTWSVGMLVSVTIAIGAIRPYTPSWAVEVCLALLTVPIIMRGCVQASELCGCSARCWKLGLRCGCSCCQPMTVQLNPEYAGDDAITMPSFGDTGVTHDTHGSLHSGSLHGGSLIHGSVGDGSSLNSAAGRLTTSVTASTSSGSVSDAHNAAGATSCFGCRVLSSMAARDGGVLGRKFAIFRQSHPATMGVAAALGLVDARALRLLFASLHEPFRKQSAPIPQHLVRKSRVGLATFEFVWIMPLLIITATMLLVGLWLADDAICQTLSDAAVLELLDRQVHVPVFGCAITTEGLWSTGLPVIHAVVWLLIGVWERIAAVSPACVGMVGR